MLMGYFSNLCSFISLCSSKISLQPWDHHFLPQLFNLLIPRFPQLRDIFSISCSKRWGYLKFCTWGTPHQSNEVCRVNACIVTANSHLYMFGGMNPHLDYILYQLSYIKFVGEPVHLLKVHVWKMSCLPIVSRNYVQWKLSPQTLP